MTGLDHRGALTFTSEAKRIEFDSDSGERKGLKEAPSTSYTHPPLIISNQVALAIGCDLSFSPS